MIVPIQGTVDDGMAHLVERAVDEANREHAAAIVLDVNSPGGLVDAGVQNIRDALFAAHEPVIAYVEPPRVLGGGADYAGGKPHRDGARRLDRRGRDAIPARVKYISALRGEFESTALRNHRNRKDRGRDGRQERRSAAI